MKTKTFHLFSIGLALITLVGCNSASKTLNFPSQSNQWTGQWEIKDPNSPQTIKFFLTPEGKLYVLNPNSSQGSIAYEIPVTKISDSAILPAGTQVITMEKAIGNNVSKARESEGKTYIRAMSRGQQAYYVEYAKFAPTIEQLGIGIKSETENYRYQMALQNDQTVMMIAQAKKPELKSYTGVVFAIGNNNQNMQTVTGICETDNPTFTPPSMPSFPNSISEPIQCPSGSHLLER
jgi:type IV pilus assembly protein PilA